MADSRIEAAYERGHLRTIRTIMDELRRDNPDARPDFAGMKFRPGQQMKAMPLQHADFIGIITDRLQLNRSDLTGACFSGAELYRVVLHDATIDGCDFSGANMTGALMDEVTDRGMATSIWFNTRLHRVLQARILAAIWHGIRLTEDGAKGTDDPAHHMTDEQIAKRSWWQAELSPVGRDRVINAIGRYMLPDEDVPRTPNSRNKRPVILGTGPFALADNDLDD